MRPCDQCQRSDLDSRGQRNKRDRFFCSFLPVVGAVVGTAILVALLTWIPRETGAQPQGQSPPRVNDKTDYWAKAIRMTDISAKLEKGIISIALDMVKEKKIVRFVYEGNGAKLPLFAYVTPAGKLVTGVSVCEPCRSTRFHIKDKLMVCNACYTEWHLETLKGIRGACLKYPPVVIPSHVENGSILIEENHVTQWKPRV